MANTKLTILQRPRQLLFIVSVVLAGFVFLHAPRAHAAACPTPTTDMGSVTSTVNITSTGSYRVWSRMTQGTASTDNSYSLEITDTAGTKTCFVVGDATLPSSFANDSTNWVDYQNGTTSSKINITASATGNYTVKMIGREDGVKLDRVGLTQDTACVPTGTGDNCFPPADTTPPTVSVTAPASGAKVKGTVTVSATAADDSGTVSKVEFYANTSLIGTDTTSPFSLNWNTSTLNQAVTLTAKAYDAAGNVTTSAGVTVTADNTPPTVSITSPTAGTLTGAVSLAATASDTGGTGVTSVDFYYGTTLISSDTTSPYSFSWPTCGIANGNYTLTAKANDGAGNTTTSAGVNITLNNPSNCSDPTPPTTSITTPVSGATFTGVTNAVIATASDNVGVTRVDLLIDGAVVANDTAAPYNFNVDSTSLSAGAHTLATRAYDAVGNSGQSANVSITVSNGSTNPGDVDGDGHVTIFDLSTLLTNYGKTSGVTRSQGDLDNNGTINIFDLSTLLTYYGT